MPNESGTVMARPLRPRQCGSEPRPPTVMAPLATVMARLAIVMTRLVRATSRATAPGLRP
jgi:hypothetical protein